MAWFFSKKAEKRDLDILKEAVQTGFNSVKEDFSKTSTWIKHLNTNNESLKEDISDYKRHTALLIKISKKLCKYILQSLYI